jgi:hypothetical protein
MKIRIDEFGKSVSKAYIGKGESNDRERRPMGGLKFLLFTLGPVASVVAVSNGVEF